MPLSLFGVCCLTYIHVQGSNYAQFGHPVFNAETIKLTKMYQFIIKISKWKQKVKLGILVILGHTEFKMLQVATCIRERTFSLLI
jgi:hypothetical protein